MADSLRSPAGLCGSCIHCKVIESAKGSSFYQCQKGLKNPAEFPKYPHLPVRSCRGWVRIRPAALEDIPSIQKIYAHWVLNGVGTFEIEPPPVEEMRKRFEEVHARGLPYVVAEGPTVGQVGGYAYATIYRPRPAYRFTVEDSVYLDPAYTGQGLGVALMEAVVRESARQGYRQMIAVIGGGMENTPSVALHERCGFEHAGVLKAVGFKFDRWLDTVLMQRRLL